MIFGENEVFQETLASFRRARRANSIEYQKLHYRKKDEDQYKEWKDIIGKNMPITLDDFQRIKYNKINVFERLGRQIMIIKKINLK